MIKLATETSPADLAWAAFDAAVIEMHAMYARTSAEADVAAATRAERMAKTAEVVRLWDAWRALFLASDEPRPAA